MLGRSQQADLDALKRERELLRRKGDELRDQAAKNKVSERAEWKEGGSATSEWAPALQLLFALSPQRHLMEVRDWMLKKEQQKNQLQMVSGVSSL